jgi:hypothetical protein
MGRRITSKEVGKAPFDVADILQPNARRPTFRSLLDAAGLAPSRPRLRVLD